MRDDDLLVIETDNVRIEFQKHDSTGLFETEWVRAHLTGSSFETIAAAWCFWTFPIVEAEISFRSRGRSVVIQSGDAIYLPPFSLVEWHKGPGQMMIEGFGRSELCGVTEEAVLFPFVGGALPTTVHEVEQILEHAPTLHVIDRTETNSAIARRLRSRINETFNQEVSIADLVRELKCSHAVATRQFCRCHGLPPVQYRNRLRIADGLQKIVFCDQSVAKVAMESGFTDTKKFRNAFKQIHQIVPGSYRNTHIKTEPPSAQSEEPSIVG